MNKATFAKQAKTASFFPATQGMLQRKCDCGNHTVAGGECVECAKKKSSLQRKFAIGASTDTLEREADRVAEQVMAAPAHHAISGVLPRIQRFSGQADGQMDVAPASVDQVLAGPGRPLESSLRQDMEQRFVHDFSRVRVHSGAAAEQSARDVNAHAYTVGHNMVFGAGRFAPGTHEGRRLLVHELTHVVQQQSIPSVIQRDAIPTGITLSEAKPFGHADLQSDGLKKKWRTYIGSTTLMQVTPSGKFNGHCVKEYLTEVANTCPARFSELRKEAFCMESKCLEFDRYGTAGDPDTRKTVTDGPDTFIDRHRTRHPESLLEGTGKSQCSVVCHQRYKFDRQHDLGSFYVIRNFRADKYTPAGSKDALHITTGEVQKVPAPLEAPTKEKFAKDVAPDLKKHGVLVAPPVP